MEQKRKIIYILSHPIQYYSPLFKYLENTNLIDCHVWYLSDHGAKESLDQEFGVVFKWDISLLDGYSYEFLKNDSDKKGFFSFINWSLIGKLWKLPAKSIIIIPGWNYFSYVLAILIGKLIGHKICLRGDSAVNHELLKNQFSRIIRGMIFRLILFPCVYKFLYVGKQNKGFYKLYGVKNKRLIKAPHAVDNDFFKAENLKKLPLKSDIKTSLGIPPDNKVILYCGKLIPKKNPLDLLNAFKLINDDNQFTLIFLGEGNLRNDIQHIIDKEQIDNVIITGFINQSKISEYYAIADVFVICSGVGETWGLVANEAMNFGLPVVVSDLTGSAPDLVNENGFVFVTNDILDLSSKLKHVLCLPESTISHMRTQSLSIIQQYSYSQITKGILQI